jgi:putative PIN family toxin of toxin-antitoxin system
MRALFDSNIFISYAASSAVESVVITIVEAALLQEFTLLMTEEVIEEFGRKVREKPYLATRITVVDANELITALSTVVEVIPAIDTIPAVGRDKKDDYLLANAVVGRAQYLVTQDENLLVLGAFEGIKIVPPGEFASQLRKRRKREREAA